MFTWICPQCGREVPPSYTECPDCAKNPKPAPPQPEAAPPQPQHYPPQPQQPQYPPQVPPPQYYPQQQQYAPPPPQYAPPQQQQYPPPPQQQYAPPPQQQYAPPQQQYAPPPSPPLLYGQQPTRRMNLPVWVLTVLFALAIGGVVGGIYALLQTGSKPQTGTGPAPTAAVENPAAKPGAKPNPIQKYIEVSGVRFVQDAKKATQVRFVLINHSEADINGLAGNVTIWGRTRKSEEDAEGSFSFSTNVGPFESKELTVPLNTKMKIYELPDWQNVTTDVQITAPAGA
ncbi:MAG TPA: hypothetical protein VMH28_22475 [Candidatus Acidoferrales bacterium]|nr:hypothetical protein [Candidatus Acidoferrales bacterium]